MYLHPNYFTLMAQYNLQPIKNQQNTIFLLCLFFKGKHKESRFLLISLEIYKTTPNFAKPKGLDKKVPLAFLAQLVVIFLQFRYVKVLSSSFFQALINHCRRKIKENHYFLLSLSYSFLLFFQLTLFPI